MNKQIIGKVYSTTDYDKFKTIVGNRPVVEKGSHFKEVLNSIKAEGQICPAIVNDRNEIIDGQHRLAICRQLGIPFVYVIGEGRGFVNIAQANAGRKWSTETFVYGYAQNGGANSASYCYLKALYDEFSPMVSKSSLVRIKDKYNPEVARQIRDGSFSMKEDEYNMMAKCLRELIKLGYADFLKENPMSGNTYWQAICYTWRHPKIDNKRLIKIMWQNEKRIPSTSKVKELLEALSIIYNKKLTLANRVYLEKDYEQKMYRKWRDAK